MDYQLTAPADRCTEHGGLHVRYMDACFAFGAQVRRPIRFHVRPVICQECGGEQDVVKLEGGRVVLLTAGTDRPHVHPSRPRVEIDEDRLAAAIVAASRTVREERRAEQPEARHVTARTAAAPALDTEPPPEPGERTIPTVTVWSPGLDDGAGE